jgi:hypothetical protein
VRDAQDLGGFLDGEPREETELHEAGLAFVEGGELRERPVEVEEVEAPRRRRDALRGLELEAHLPLAALGRVASPRVVDEDLAHGAGGDAEEMRAVLPVDRAAADELEVGLVDEGRGLERVPRALVPEIGAGAAAQLVVHEREERVERTRVSGAPPPEELRDLSGRGDVLGVFHVGK